MNIKFFSFSLLLSSALYTSTFAMDSDLSPVDLTQDTSSKIIAAKPSIWTFDITDTSETRVVKDATILTGNRKDKLGPFDVLSPDVFTYCMRMVGESRIMGINRTFYTLATGYKPERMNQIGLGPDKEPDYCDPLLLDYPRKWSNIFKKPRERLTVLKTVRSVAEEGKLPKKYQTIRLGKKDFLLDREHSLARKEGKHKEDYPHLLLDKEIFEFAGGVMLITTYINEQNERVYIDDQGHHFATPDLLYIYTPETIPSVLWYVLLKTVKNPHLDFVPHIHNSPVELLDLSDNQFDGNDDGGYCSQILRLLAEQPGCSKLRTLNVSKSYYNPDSLGLFLKSIKTKHPFLESMKSYNSADLTTEVLVKIVQSLQGSNVEELFLEDNNFADPYDRKAFVSSLKQTNIEHLSLRGCAVNNEHALGLVTELLEQNGQLTKLDLAYNNIDEKTQKSITQLIQGRNAKLEIIWLDPKAIPINVKDLSS